MSEQLSISEIYASIQGESSYAGRPCTFIRLARCPLRCSWCDTVYSFQSGEPMAVDAVLAEVDRLGWPLVEVTGGEPLAQKSCPELLGALCDAGYEVLLETSGAFPVDQLDPRVTVIADLKCPGSGEHGRNLWPTLVSLRAQDELKIVVADEADFAWARRQLVDRLAGLKAQVLWSPVTPGCPPDQLAAWILQSRVPGRMQIQLHKVLWPDADRGV